MTTAPDPLPTTLSPTPTPGAGGRLGVKVTAWQAVAAWTWDAGDDVCGICRAAFDGCPPEGKFPGDDSPVVWGVCNHAYHLQCITKVLSLLSPHCSHKGLSAHSAAQWLAAQAEHRCPICRQAWEFKAAAAAAAG